MIPTQQLPGTHHAPHGMHHKKQNHPLQPSVMGGFVEGRTPLNPLEKTGFITFQWRYRLRILVILRDGLRRRSVITSEPPPTCIQEQ